MLNKPFGIRISYSGILWQSQSILNYAYNNFFLKKVVQSTLMEWKFAYLVLKSDELNIFFPSNSNLVFKKSYSTLRAGSSTDEHVF